MLAKNAKIAGYRSRIFIVYATVRGVDKRQLRVRPEKAESVPPSPERKAPFPANLRM